jgi:hypothetical protein
VRRYPRPPATREIKPRPPTKSKTARSAPSCSQSCASRSGPMPAKVASLCRTGSCISGVSSDRRMSEERCVSPPRTPLVSEASRITLNLRPLYRRCEASPRSEPACSAMMDDQQAVIAFLSKPSSYGPASERVDIIETHVSLVFLVSDRAYKLKRCRKISLSRLLHSGAPPARLRSRARSEPPHGADPLSRSPSPPRGRVSR